MVKIMTTEAAVTPNIPERPAQLSAERVRNWSDVCPIDYPRLHDLSTALATQWRSADPFPHVLIEDFFPAAVIARLCEEFPAAGRNQWVTYDTPDEFKSTSRGADGVSPFTEHVLGELNSRRFIGFLQELTGIQPIVPDPYFYGGGLHEVRRGGWLDPHVDFPQHPMLPLTRQLNLIVYLNPAWRDEWGGALELFDAGSASRRRVEPLFNRAIIFATPDALHGHPQPLACPANVVRRSLAMFYWTGGQTTGRPQVTFKSTDRKKGAAGRLLRQITPPILMSAALEVRRLAASLRVSGRDDEKK